MNEASLRRAVIEKIYDNNPDDYKDIRKLHSLEEMGLRLHCIKTLMQATPNEKRKEARYKSLQNEYQLIRQKYLIYGGSVNLPFISVMTKELLKMTDRHFGDPKESKEESAHRKRLHTTYLLNYVFVHKTYEELCEISMKKVRGNKCHK